MKFRPRPKPVNPSCSACARRPLRSCPLMRISTAICLCRENGAPPTEAFHCGQRCAEEMTSGLPLRPRSSCNRSRKPGSCQYSPVQKRSPQRHANSAISKLGHAHALSRAPRAALTDEYNKAYPHPDLWVRIGFRESGRIRSDLGSMHQPC